MSNDRKIYIKTAVAGYGAISVVTQLIYLRELLNVFYSNELVFGILLSNWLLLGAVGAKSSKLLKNSLSLQTISFLLYLLAFMPIVSLFGLRFFMPWFILPGTLASITEIFTVSLLFIAPFTFLSGFLFPVVAELFSKEQNIGAGIRMAYFWDSAGMMLGGLLYSFILIFFLNSSQSALAVLFMGAISSLLLSSSPIKCPAARKLPFAISFFTVAAIVSLLIIDTNKITLEQLYPGQTIVAENYSPYGSVVVTESKEQLNFYSNGSLMYSDNDPAAREESVHYAMIQRDDFRNVLLVSGALAGMAKEIDKYHPQTIVCTELNPSIIDVAKRYTDNLDVDNISTVAEDPRAFLRETDMIFDAVIMALSEPRNASENRLFTIEFFELLKQRIAPGAVVSAGINSAAVYQSSEASDLNSIVYNTLDSVFNNVIIIAGRKNYFIASDSALSKNFINDFENRGIVNEYVNKYYLDSLSLLFSSELVSESINSSSPINTDFLPQAYFLSMNFLLSYFKSSKLIIAVVICLLLIFAAAGMNKISFGLFAAGLSGSSAEIILVMALQIIIGSAFYLTGLLITVFMGGMIAGLYFGRKLKYKAINFFLGCQLAALLYFPLLALLLYLMHSRILSQDFNPVLFTLLTLLISSICGCLFSAGAQIKLASDSSARQKASSLYSADMLGASVGALFITSLLIPLFGIYIVSIFVTVINAISLFIVIISRKSYS